MRIYRVKYKIKGQGKLQWFATERREVVKFARNLWEQYGVRIKANNIETVELKFETQNVVPFLNKYCEGRK